MPEPLWSIVVTRQCAVTYGRSGAQLAVGRAAAAVAVGINLGMAERRGGVGGAIVAGVLPIAVSILAGDG